MTSGMAPTRMNLLTLKAQIKLAADGVSLLKGKRDALMQELITRAKAFRNERDELHRRGRVAGGALAMARAVRGTPELRSASLASQRELMIDVKTDRVWGLNLGQIELESIVRKPWKRNMSVLDSSAHIQEGAETCEAMVEQLLICAPLERNLLIIGEEVKKVSRRINALEEALLPRLRGQMRQIARVLDEREREDTFRLKRIKGKKAAQKKAAQDAAAAQAEAKSDAA